jgi:hypothetical protein
MRAELWDARDERPIRAVGIRSRRPALYNPRRLETSHDTIRPPLQEVERPLGTRTIVIPIGNHDNNQHSFDENLRIQNLWDGIELMAALLTI